MTEEKKNISDHPEERTPAAGGRILGKRYISRYAWVFVFVLAFTLTYMDNRIKCERQYRRISQLRDTLEIERYREMQAEAELLRSGREDTIQELMRGKGLDLGFTKEPPLHVNMEK